MPGVAGRGAVDRFERHVAVEPPVAELEDREIADGDDVRAELARRERPEQDFGPDAAGVAHRDGKWWRRHPGQSVEGLPTRGADVSRRTRRRSVCGSPKAPDLVMSQRGPAARADGVVQPHDGDARHERAIDGQRRPAHRGDERRGGVSAHGEYGAGRSAS